MGAGEEADGDTGALEHGFGEGEAEAGAFFAIGNVLFEFLTFEFLQVAFFVFAPVDAVGGVDELMERFGGKDPAVGLIEGTDAGIGLFDIGEEADALHVGLAGEEPEIADVEIFDGINRCRVGNANFERIRSALGDAFDKAGPGGGLDALEGFPIQAGEGFAFFVGDAGFDELVEGGARSCAGDFEIGAAVIVTL